MFIATIYEITVITSITFITFIFDSNKSNISNPWGGSMFITCVTCIA